MLRRFVAALTLALILGTTEGQGRQAGASTRLPHLRMEAAGSANPVAKQEVQFRGSDFPASSEGTKSEVEDGEWRWEQCRYRRLDGRRGFSDWEVRRTIRCAVEHWAVYGGFEKALAVAQCESGLNEFAVSASGTFLGLYQHHRIYWSGRFVFYAPRWWRLRPSAFNARTQAVVTARMVHAGGWGPWACA